jgi:hypothetical protein
MVEVTPRLDSSHIIVGTRPPRLSLFPNVYHNFKKSFGLEKIKKKRKVDNHLRKRRHGVQSERRKKKKNRRRVEKRRRR